MRLLALRVARDQLEAPSLLVRRPDFLSCRPLALWYVPVLVGRLKAAGRSVLRCTGEWKLLSCILR